MRDKIIREMKRVVKKDGGLAFIDFEVPLPRNKYACLAKTIESIAGRPHSQNFKDYLAQGGLAELLKKNHLQEEKLECLKGGIVAIVKARNG